MTRAHDEWGTNGPVLLGPSSTGNLPVQLRPVAQHLGVVAGEPRPIPKGWPLKAAEPAWSWLRRVRAPMVVVIVGAAGGVGTSTVCALVAETIAAGSPGPTVLLDQSLTPWGDVTRRLLGQRAGLGAPAALERLHRERPESIVRSSPMSSAGAAVLLDSTTPSLLRDLRILVTKPGGALLVDGGRLDPELLRRLDVPAVRPVVVVVGRADRAAAETTLAGVAWLRGVAPVEPLVVLSATAPVKTAAAAGAVRMARAAGHNVVYLPFDGRLAHGQDLTLHKVGKSTAEVVPQIITGIQAIQEGPDHASAPR